MYKICQCCKRQQELKEFYLSRSGQRINICKNCITNNINIYDSSTFIPILKEIDVPYIPKEWDRIIAKNSNKTVLSKYLALMKLASYKTFRYKDSNLFQ